MIIFVTDLLSAKPDQNQIKFIYVFSLPYKTLTWLALKILMLLINFIPVRDYDLSMLSPFKV